MTSATRDAPGAASKQSQKPGAWLDNKVHEVAQLRRRERVSHNDMPLVADFIDTFLATHDVDPDTIEKKMKYQLNHAKRAFGKKRLNELQPIEIDAWRSTLPPLTRHEIFRTFKQVLNKAVALRQIEQNPAEHITNRRVLPDEPREVQPFHSWEQVHAIGDELVPRFQHVPIVLVGTGLRPEELWGLERTDLDRKNRLLNVERVFTMGRLKPCKKSTRQRRQVPLSDIVMEALEAIPKRLDTKVLSPGHDGSYVRHDTFRLRHWVPAFAAAGIEYRAVCVPPLIRRVGDSCGRAALQPRPRHGHLDRADRPDLRTPRARLARLRSRASQ